MERRRKIEALFVILALMATPVLVIKDPEFVEGADISEETRGTTLYVGHDQTYKTIQSAVNASSAGDTIRVYDGTYNETVTVDKSVEIRGNGTSRTVLNITGHSIGFEIMASNVSIQGMWILDTSYPPHVGIYGENADNLSIQGCVLEDLFMGILLQSSTNSTVRSNTINTVKTGHGIYFRDSRKLTAILNDVTSENGIYLENTTGSTVTRNTLLKEGGIRLGYNSSENIISHNRIENNNNWSMGISLYRYCNDNDILNNTITTKWTGIRMEWWCEGNIIRKNTVTSNINGMQLMENSSKNTILYNIVKDNYDGIAIRSQSHLNRIHNNTCEGQDSNGIFLENVIENRVSDNILINNRVGITMNNSDSNIIERCTMESNEFAGIAGKVSDKNWIHGCSIKFNHYGLILGRSYDGSIMYCEFIENELEAINLSSGYSGSYRFKIHNNSFIDNNGAGETFLSSNVQVYSCYLFDKLNHWDDEVGHGNYWSDWTSPDNDSNGIVDQPYPIDQVYPIPLIKDNYPLTEPPVSMSTVPRILTKNVKAAYVGVPYLVEYKAYDPDGGASELLWTMSTNATWLSFSLQYILYGTPGIGEVGSYWVSIEVSNAVGSDSINFTLSVLRKNVPPNITTDDITSCMEDQFYSVDYNATDDDILTWSLETDADFLSINKDNGILSGTPTNYYIGIHQVKLFVSDGVNTDSTTFDLTVINVNDPPEIGDDPSNPPVYDPDLRKYVRGKVDLNCTEDIPLSLNFSARDVDPTKDNLTWTLESGSDFIKLNYLQTDQGNHVLSKLVFYGTPTNGHVGTHRVTLKVSDGKSGIDMTTFNLTVFNTNDPPIITTDDVVLGHRNTLYMVDYDATDIDPVGDVLNWTFSSNATFLSLNSTSGVLSGTPSNSQTGLYWINITVSDGNGGTDGTNFTLAVLYNNSSPGAIGPAPSAFFDEDTEDTSIDIRALFWDPDGDLIAYKVFRSVHIAAELTEDQRLLLKPDKNWAGTEKISIIASDGYYSFELFIPVTIRNVNDPPVINGLNLESQAKEGEDILIRSDVLDPDLEYGDLLSYRWEIRGLGIVGTKPDLRIELDEGEYNISLTITDTAGEARERSMVLKVTGEHNPPTGGWFIPIAVIIILLLVMLLFALGVIIRMRKRNIHATGDTGFLFEIPERPKGGILQRSMVPILGDEPLIEVEDDIIRKDRLESGETVPWDEEEVFLEDLDLLSSLDMDEEPEIREAFDDLFSGEKISNMNDILRMKEELRERLMNDRIDHVDYEELVGNLDDLME